MRLNGIAPAPSASRHDNRSFLRRGFDIRTVPIRDRADHDIDMEFPRPTAPVTNAPGDRPALDVNGLEIDHRRNLNAQEIIMRADPFLRRPASAPPLEPLNAVMAHVGGRSAEYDCGCVLCSPKVWMTSSGEIFVVSPTVPWVPHSSEIFRARSKEIVVFGLLQLNLRASPTSSVLASVNTSDECLRLFFDQIFVVGFDHRLDDLASVCGDTAWVGELRER